MIRKEDLNVILHSELRKQMIEHQIGSINTFYEQGLEQIMKHTFNIKVNRQNMRQITDLDKSITQFEVEVKITNARLTPPEWTERKSGNPVPLFPNSAHKYDRTYSSALRIDADIVATAYLKDGGTMERIDEIKDFKITSLPVMVGSNLCHTNKKSAMALSQMKEDPTDVGGYYIINGKDWVINTLENIAFNSFRAFHNQHGKEAARGELISKPGDAFENSFEIIIFLLNTGEITVQVAISSMNGINGKPLAIPFYIMFRALGVSSDKEMMQHILLSFEDPISQVMASKLEKAMHVTYAINTRPYTQADCIQYIARNLDDFKDNFTKTGGVAGKTDEERKNKQLYMNNRVNYVLDHQFLPHIGMATADRSTKIRYFGMLIRKLLLVEMDKVDSTDRDSFSTKRVHSAGISMSKSFKTQFNLSIVGPIKKIISDELQNTEFTNIYFGQTIQSKINGREFEANLSKSISAADVTIRVKRKEVSNHLSAQQLHRKNELTVLSTLRNVSTATTSSSKSSSRADEMRRVQPSGCGYICPIQSAGEGDSVGMQKQMCVSASITPSNVMSALLEDAVIAHPDIVPLASIAPYQIIEDSLTTVSVNGKWIGLTHDPAKIYRDFRNKRRKGQINRKATLSWNYKLSELNLWCDAGRIIRPMLCVYNSDDNYEPGPEARAHAIKLKLKLHSVASRSHTWGQYCAITPQMIDALYNEMITCEDLIRMEIMEYIASEESEICLYAQSYDHLHSERSNSLRPFTHCEIEPAILGLAALTSPFLEHNQIARVCYQTNQVKQTCGWFAMNWKYKNTKERFLQYTTQKPLTHTFSNHFLKANGANAIVAVMIYEGFNQEDSLILNKTSVENGFFNGTYFGHEDVELDKGYQYGIPNVSDTMDIKFHANYDKLDATGMIPIGTVVEKNDVMVGIRVELSGEESYKYADRSLIYTHHEPAIIHDIIKGYNQEDVRICKVIYRSIRSVIMGDKFSARSGQKGVCGLLLEACDMPMTENGIVPDIIMNPHAYPSRMTISQLIESLANKLCALQGITIDATFQHKIDIAEIKRELTKLGVSPSGYDVMYNGRTGERINTRIFVIPNYYQRLQKFATNARYAVNEGPTSIITRQPVGSRKMNGGIRLGEMERDVMLCNEAGVMLAHKIYDHSDGYTHYVCATCGSIHTTVVNFTTNTFTCSSCKSEAKIHKFSSSWASITMAQEFRAMGMDIHYNVRPPTLEDHIY